MEPGAITLMLEGEQEFLQARYDVFSLLLFLTYLLSWKNWLPNETNPNGTKVKVKSRATPTEYTSTGLQFADGSRLDADVIVFCTGFSTNMVPETVSILGSELGSRLESFWGINEEGELRGAFKRLSRKWFSTGYARRSESYGCSHLLSPPRNAPGLFLDGLSRRAYFHWVARLRLVSSIKGVWRQKKSCWLLGQTRRSGFLAVECHGRALDLTSSHCRFKQSLWEPRYHTLQLPLSR